MEALGIELVTGWRGQAAFSLGGICIVVVGSNEDKDDSPSRGEDGRKIGRAKTNRTRMGHHEAKHSVKDRPHDRADDLGHSCIRPECSRSSDPIAAQNLDWTSK